MARDFNGTTDQIDYNSVFNTAGSPITISCWAWFDILNQAAAQYLFNSAVFGGGPGTLFHTTAAVNGSLTMTRIGGTTFIRATNADVFAIGRWTHCLVTHNGVMTSAASAFIYVNGLAAAYATTTNGATETVANSGFMLGGRTANDRGLNGRMAEVGVWNRVLSAGEIAALANGYAPSFFPAGLKLYPDLLVDPRDNISGSGMLDGTRLIEHPPKIIYPKRGYSYAPAPAAPGGFQAAWASQRSRIIGAGMH